MNDSRNIKNKKIDLYVTKRDGKKELFDIKKIKEALFEVIYDIKNGQDMADKILHEFQLTLYEDISTRDLDESLINTAVANIKNSPDYDKIATRLLLKNIYKTVLGDFSSREDLTQKHQGFFAQYIEKGVRQKILDPELIARYDLEKISSMIDVEDDELLTYSGLRTIMKRYMLRDRDHNLMETPQFFRARVAMALAINEDDPEQWTRDFYKRFSGLEIVTGGSVSIGAGTTVPSLSNCYLMDIDDSIDGIGKSISDTMKLLKATGGIGMSVTRLRAEGSEIKSNNTHSSGPIPFLNVIDASLQAVSRAGKKKGALCFYMENWHIDFRDFLDAKQNAGDEYRRFRTANTAVYLSDEFMKRVERDDDWYLFDPSETSDLIELYGVDFSKRYAEYVKKADAGELKRFQKIKAREQFRSILVSLSTTSHPWLTWKDAINVRALNNNTGTIHCSNLCTEITLPQDKNNISVCNLAYVNLARHFDKNIGDIDWPKLKKNIRLSVRLLDNLIDVNQPPVQEAKKADKENRAIGLGAMGLAEVLENLSLSYDSEESYDFVDRVFEFISYHAIDESATLAESRGSYDNFIGSAWSKGFVPIDTTNELFKLRGDAPPYNLGGNNKDLDWEKLRQKVRFGMRNATVMAIAPNANGGIAAGTSPGIDPRFTQVFSRSTLSGKYLEVNKNLFDNLSRMDLWDKVREDIILARGDISSISAIPDNIKQIYKTSFTISPYAYVKVAARAQKWIDQSISRNIYLRDRDIDEMMKLYIYAWKMGLKTTYYLHMMPRHSAEQSTMKVNKSTTIGKLGFGAVRKSSSDLTPGTTMSDPQEKLVCDSCA